MTGQYRLTGGDPPDPDPEEIQQNDPRWVWELDPQRPWSELTQYNGNRQVTNLSLTQFTNSGALPANDGTNQIYERVSDPSGSGRTVYRHHLHKDLAYGTGWSNQTWRSEISNTAQTPVWGQEYWLATAVRLGTDFSVNDFSINIFEFHVPYPQPNAIGISPFTMFVSTNFNAAVRYNAGTPSTQNDYTTAATWSAAATREVWHFLILNFKLGADSTSNFLRMWHKEGSGSLTQVMNYTGRIGYDANSASGDRHNYAKCGMYSWTYPWPGTSTSRTLWNRGFRLIKADAGTPTINQNVMLALLE